ncbi:unnamed protein product [Cylindrotheca closterium]|uniref:Helicase-associated domain-containing protein n=1 Tax=Cylindrotheca closterium TaxID=2856 RepID=A0AAD2FDC0_9STRA|nr:unnamed protein product [Cylindrotheca closterium]
MGLNSPFASYHSPEPPQSYTTSMRPHHAVPESDKNAGPLCVLSNLFGDLPADAFEPVPIGESKKRKPSPLIDASVVLELAFMPYSPEPQPTGNLPCYPTQTDNAASSASNNQFGDRPADPFEPLPIGGRATKTSGPSVLDVSVLDCALELALVAVSKSVSNVRKASAPITASAPMVKRRRILSSKNDDQQPHFRGYQEKQWAEQFEELLNFKNEHGHCLVPHTYPKNQALARWVKRQRYQYKLKAAGKVPFTMTDDRIKKLEAVGFVWNTHAAIWDKRLKQLVEYRNKYGDCNVPSNCQENPKLATWIKCQRRQYKLFWSCNKESSMTLERMNALNDLGFSWKVGSDHSVFNRNPSF